MNILALGTIVEYFDFISFSFICKYIPFFGGYGTYTQFALGYGARLAGSLVMSLFSRRYGEQRMLIVSIFMITLSTTIIACLPNIPFSFYILILLRIIRFAFAFEFPAGFSVASESAKSYIVVNGATKGYILATIVFSLIFNLLGSEAISSFGWRIPFIIGGIAGFYLLLQRVDFSPKPMPIWPEYIFFTTAILFAMYSFQPNVAFSTNINISCEMLTNLDIVTFLLAFVLLFFKERYSKLIFSGLLLKYAFTCSILQMKLVSIMPGLSSINILSLLFSCLIGTFISKRYMYCSIILYLCVSSMQMKFPVILNLCFNQLFVTSCMISGMSLLREGLSKQKFLMPVIYNFIAFAASL